jgi:hypothetical protein
MPKARREHARLHTIERAREVLRLQTLAVSDPRVDAETNRKRGEAIVEQRRQNREWKPNGAVMIAPDSRARFYRSSMTFH